MEATGWVMCCPTAMGDGYAYYRTKDGHRQMIAIPCRTEGKRQVHHGHALRATHCQNCGKDLAALEANRHIAGKNAVLDDLVRAVDPEAA